MELEYVPLLRVARGLHDLPLGRRRFQQYLRMVMNEDGTDTELTPLLVMNPMGKAHVTALLDALLDLDADGIGARAAADASARLADADGDGEGEGYGAVPGEFRAGLVVADDLMGGWTNRYDVEFTFRFGHRPLPKPRGAKAARRRPWVTGILWSSEAASARAAREAVLTSAYRTAYTHRHGPALTLRDMLAQEGSVLRMVDCPGPLLDPDDLDYTREVLLPFLDAEDKRTAIECLFGDPAARSLGFTPRGLSRWAGLALALHDARARNAPGGPDPSRTGTGSAQSPAPSGSK